MRASRTATGRVTGAAAGRRRADSAQPASRTTAATAIRYQAMSSGPRSVRSPTRRPVTPLVPQQRAARTTRTNPRARVDGAAGEDGVDMTLLRADPEGDGSGAQRTARVARTRAAGGQPRGAPVRRRREGAARGRAGASWPGA